MNRSIAVIARRARVRNSSAIGRFAFATVVGFGVTFVLADSAGAQILHNGSHEVIRQQDQVQAFNVATGKGFQTGTATGPISGTTSVDFHFTIIGPPAADGALPISFANKVIITDLDGDQLFFDNDGTGEFHAGLPGDPFAGTGGPLRGTYVLTGGTGKYGGLAVGTQLAYKAIWTNPPNGAMGTVYVELTAR